MKLNFRALSLALASIAVLIVMSAAVVVSQGPQAPQGPEGRPGPRDGFGRGPGGPRGGGLPMFRDLNLSDDQKAQIKKIMDTEAANTKELHDKLKALHDSEPEPFATTFDEAAVRATAEARAKIDVELQVSHARTMSQVASILTAEQRQQLASRRQQFREGPPPPPEP